MARRIGPPPDKRCRKCEVTKRVGPINWHMRRTGFPTFAVCRSCRNPSGRRPGRPVGSLDRMQRHREAKRQAAKGGRESHAAGRSLTLNPNALLDAAKRYGIDPAKIAAGFADDNNEG